MAPVNRKRKVISVTLSPLIVQQAKEAGATDGETRFSLVVEIALREYIASRRKPAPKPARRGSPVPKKR
jgi:hypothetical protein